MCVHQASPARACLSCVNQFKCAVVDATEPRIEIFKPFGEAYDLTKEILFQPFDLKKWFVIGFAAWLAHLGSGGGFNYRTSQQSEQKLSGIFAQVPHSLIVIGACLLAFVVVVLMVVFAWLRARGRFILIDCIVKNRGAITGPWREFRSDGNSYFFFAVVVGTVFAIVAALLSLPFMLPIIRGVTFLHIHDVYLISTGVAWMLVIILVVLAWALIANFMVPIMYRRRCRAWEACGMVVSLIRSYPGEFVLYCLFIFVLAIAAAIVACLAICFTCCIAAFPYVGTVILLPIFILLRSFSLCFLRQFGPDYDVWQGMTIPEPPPITPPPAVPPLPLPT